MPFSTPSDDNQLNGSAPLRPNNLPAQRSSELARYVADSTLVDSYIDPVEANADGLNLLQILSIFWRRRNLIAVIFMLVVVAVALYTWLQRPIYESVATVLINTQANNNPSKTGDEDLPGLSAILSNDKARSLSTQIEVLGGSLVREGAIGRLTPELRDAVKEFHTATFTPVGDTDIVAINVTSYNPVAAARLCDAISTEYIQQSMDQNRAEMRAATKYLSDQLIDVRNRLNDSNDKLKSYRQKYGIVDFQNESSATVEQVNTINRDLLSTQTEYSSAVAQLNALRAMASRVPAEISSTTTVRRPIVEALKQQLTKLELDRLAAIQEYTPTSAQVQSIDGQISAIKERLSHESPTEVGTLDRKVNPTRMSIEQDLAEAESHVRSLGAKIETLKGQGATTQNKLKQLPDREYQLNQMTSNVVGLEQTYKLLNSKYQELRITEEAVLSNARVISPAFIPLHPISPQRGRNLLFGTFFGVIIALGLALLMDTIDHRVQSEDEAEAASNLPALAFVPFVAERSRQSLLDRTDKPSPLLESYRMLRTNLAFSSLSAPVRSLVVTSSQPNEGKSVSALNLAIVMALGGKRVILVDGDLRRPSMHRLLQCSNEVGLTDVIAGHRSLEEALQPTSIENLKVLSTGTCPHNPPEVLDSPAGRACIAQIINAADFVVIDSPPAMIMTDALIIASMVDAAILVISVNEARKNDIARTCQLLSQTGVKMLGTIPNKIGSNFGGYQGYYYNYRYNYNNYNSYFGDESKTKKKREERNLPAIAEGKDAASQPTSVD